ncbi:DNA polymerase-4 [Ilumatobacter fluminis]|uniref:DNA polymerase IV n=1 Tax=Ilumatobacter fluminis TaxID=467091 RepID=A0A4R7I0Q0_9ACTN|nr:DNA polymerase IV [Ilumatobacter fluminis]TDT16985.1 DNA polymerase-4 [Ilumatobacter fluminis]
MNGSTVTVASEGSASILHADLDSFYASVEQRDRPELLGKPVIVGGGIVLAASYEAKRRGVYTPMPEHRARRLCPDAIVVSPRFDAYTEASRRVFEIFDDTTPLVEGMSIDEAFLDVRGLLRTAGTPAEIAARLRQRVAAEVGLPITVGVARTKFLAKVASGVAKPDGLLVVDPARETEFLHPLPVGKLWGVGPITERKLNDRGLVTVADVAAVAEEHLVAMVGAAAGRHLHALANHRDPRRVDTGRRRGSIGSQQALGRGPKSFDTIEALLLGIVDRVTRRMRTAERVGRTVTVRFRFGDFERATRARSLPHPTSATEPVAAVAMSVLREHRSMIEQRGLTLIGLSVGNLRNGSEGVEQLVLPFGRKDTSGLDSTVDDLRRRFGHAALTRASLVHQRGGFETPKLPD